MPYNPSFVLVDVALQISDFRELSGSTGPHTYFRHHDGRIVQVDRTQDMQESHLRELADQAKINQEVFLERIATLRSYISHRQQ